MLVIAAVVQAGENRAQQDATATSELIEVLRTGTGQRRWRARFDAAINADHVDILLRINLVLSRTFSRPNVSVFACRPMADSMTWDQVTIANNLATPPSN